MKYRIVIILLCCLFTLSAIAERKLSLLNASYDPTRELYDDYNKYFIQLWRHQTGEEISIYQAHNGSGAQARAVIDGLPADVVTLALSYDIDRIALKAKLLPLNWQKQFPNNSCPYTSTIVFLVRQHNPKHIYDWNDLIRKDVQVIAPNPKTSGGARWIFLAAWGYVINKTHDEKQAETFVSRLYRNIPVLDAGARAATTTFAQRDIGDVLLTWENEAYLVTKTFGTQKFSIVIPSISVLTEPPVALVAANAARKGTTSLARAYLANLYTVQAQDIIARHFFRPYDKTIERKYQKQFVPVQLFKVVDFGGWAAVQKKFFDDGALFDRIYH